MKDALLYLACKHATVSAELAHVAAESYADNKNAEAYLYTAASDAYAEAAYCYEYAAERIEDIDLNKYIAEAEAEAASAAKYIADAKSVNHA